MPRRFDQIPLSEAGWPDTPPGVGGVSGGSSTQYAEVDMTAVTKREARVRGNWTLQSITGLRSRGVKLRVFRPIAITGGTDLANVAWNLSVGMLLVNNDAATTDPDGAVIADKLTSIATLDRAKNTLSVANGNPLTVNSNNRRFLSEWWLKTSDPDHQVQISHTGYTAIVAPFAAAEQLALASLTSAWKLFRLEGVAAAGSTLELRLKPTVSGTTYLSLHFAGVSLHEILPAATDNVTLPFSVLDGDILELSRAAVGPAEPTIEQSISIELVPV